MGGRQAGSGSMCVCVRAPRGALTHHQSRYTAAAVNVGRAGAPLQCCAVTGAVTSAVQVQELQALRQQLEPEVDLPQLQPLRDEVERLDTLLRALHQLQVDE